jgi:hypothetical protein
MIQNCETCKCSEDLPSSFWDDILEAGEKAIQVLYRVELRALCKANGIEKGNYVTVYLKKKFSGQIIEAGIRKVQNDYRISFKDICEKNDLKLNDIVIVYIKKMKSESSSLL